MVLSRSERGALARKTKNQHIPVVLKASARARAGISSSKLLRDLKASPSDSPGAALPLISVIEADTLQAAFPLATDGNGKVAILSMASELRPGGGFLSGANSQEESLCMRTTLYPALRDDFYRLPDVGCIYTQDICVFRGTYPPGGESTAPGAEVNPPSQWWFVDVISCAAVRGPDVDDNGLSYAVDQQRDLMREKVKCIFRAAASQGCRRLVLGAFGCGAFGNPPNEVALLFRRALLGREGRASEFAGSFDEVVFAIRGGRQDTLSTFRFVLDV
ncbi:unnamed protein product [Mycena citricolor]|uniref:Microbial-type PARG catalytic domain-containing protein n=1 Tax=Mycena citricolor TaxID=2018698 RepID=A0AAD2Q2Y5_9AGAR|nr:unnamed protein product [Mycena citricolor]